MIEVIDFDEEKETTVTDSEDFPKEVEASPYDDLNRVWLGNGYFYKPASLLWKSEKDGIIHELSPKNKHGTYSYYKYAVDGTWGRVKQLTQEEAMWLTLDLNPALMSYV